MTHGTQAGYKAGCRCTPCRDATARAANVYRLARMRYGLRKVAATGTRRRVLALGILGWSNYAIASRCGLSSRQVQRIGSGDTPLVNVDTAAAIRKVYDELWNKTPSTATGPEKVGVAHARRAAIRNGGHPPLAWDDDTIDDPNAQPDTGTATQGFGGRPAVDTADDVRWYLDEIEPRATAQQVAERLGYRDANPLYVALRRAGADDLRDRLTRNTRDAAERDFSPPPRRPRPTSERQSA